MVGKQIARLKNLSQAAPLCGVPIEWLRGMVRDGKIPSREVRIVGSCINEDQFDAIKALYASGALPTEEPAAPQPELPRLTNYAESELIPIEDASAIVGISLTAFVRNGISEYFSIVSRSGIPVSKLRDASEMMKLRNEYFGDSNGGRFVGETEYAAWLRDAEPCDVYEGSAFDGHGDLLDDNTARELTSIPFSPFTRRGGRLTPNNWVGSEDRLYLRKDSVEAILGSTRGRLAQDLAHIGRHVRKTQDNEEFAETINRTIAAKNGDIF